MTTPASEIRRIRSKLGLTQAGLAALLHPPVAREHVARWESGATEPLAGILLQVQAMEASHDRTPPTNIPTA